MSRRDIKRQRHHKDEKVGGKKIKVREKKKKRKKSSDPKAGETEQRGEKQVMKRCCRCSSGAKPGGGVNLRSRGVEPPGR